MNTGWAAAVQLLHARIVLKAAISAGSRPWTETEIVDALDTSASIVHGAARLLSNRALRRRWRGSAQPVGRIANGMGPGGPRGSPWPGASPRQVALGGPANYSPTHWSHGRSSTLSARRGCAPPGKKRAQTVAGEAVGNPAPGQRRRCVCPGGGAGGLHASL